LDYKGIEEIVSLEKSHPPWREYAVQAKRGGVLVTGLVPWIIKWYYNPIGSLQLKDRQSPFSHEYSATQAIAAYSRQVEGKYNIRQPKPTWIYRFFYLCL